MERKDREYFEKVKETFDYLKKIVPFQPDIIITLGTGLSSLGDRVDKLAVFPYRDLPNFPQSTVETHRGELVFGILENKKVAVLQGRFHFYEGYSAKEITFPLRVLSLFRPKLYLVSNAAGGLNLNFKPGDLMVIRDHINLIPDNPLRGLNNEEWGPRFPDMSCAYDKEMREFFKKVALDLGEEIREGVYVAVPGPSLETPAETRFLRMIGADAVGMSTVPEVIVAVHAGLKVLGISVVSNVNDPDNFAPILFSEVVEQSKRAEKRLEKLIREFLRKLCL